MTCNQIIGPFFTEQSILSNFYLDLVVEYIVPHLDGLQPDAVFQQDRAPPVWGLEVAAAMDRKTRPTPVT